MVNGFLSFCDWFFDNVAPNGKYFISPLRINGSAIESIRGIGDMLLNQFIAPSSFPVGGNLSALSYGPSLGKLINRKDMIQNKNSEKGYRDVVLNISGTAANVVCSKSNLVIPCQRLANSLCIFTFPTSISRSTIGERFGSNACTLIAVKFETYCFQNKLDLYFSLINFQICGLIPLLIPSVMEIRFMMSCIAVLLFILT